MVGEKIQLEDITKKIWTVTISEVEGSLAFENGWDYFSNDHNLEIGDLLVFEWVKSSHFSVQIYDRTGCPRFKFSMNNNIMKRKRNINKSTNIVQDMNPNTTTVVVPHPDFDMNYSKSGTEFTEETFYMINRINNNNSNNIVGCHEDQSRRSLLFDLSSFEKPKTMMLPLPLPPRYDHKESVLRTSRLLCDAVCKVPQPKERIKTTPWVVNDTKMVVRNHQTTRDQVHLPLSVKREPIDANDVQFIMSVTWKGLLSISRGLEDILTGLSRKRTKIILLRGYDISSMPVLYHDGFQSKFIGDGWEAFLKINNVKEGECVVFKLENKSEFIFSRK
ncbi:uncharacterized protein LOC124937075 [Impatiens glandulifera]|uniref:uncharacterized protein LOC124937075 n=1 Tax=Impatiens glandulifera TaxID=253017 RepID=UPI001FB1082B|nr:uncharacterized protein LOC124937075 [Impatiens glandulifera]